MKLSNGARNGVERGWYREAVLKLKAPGGKVYYIQCTTWRDKKQVCFLSSNQVGFSNGLSVKRHVKGKSTREVIEGPRAQRDYITFFNAVDRSDRDSADWSTSIRTNRYYIRILCWVLDRVVHTLFIVVVYCQHHGIGKPCWKKYKNKHTGRPDFQIDLGIDLLNYGIGLDWNEVNRPDYMRAGGFVPCDCNRCFFCINGHTSGIKHAGDKRRSVVYKCGKRARTVKCTTARVNIGKGSKYCKMCFRKQGDEGTAAQRKKKCKFSRCGCPVCEEHICTSCWAVGYDLHINK